MNYKTACEKLFDIIMANNQLSKEYSEGTSCYFSAMVGHKYYNCKDADGNPFRLMLVGRATNGWAEYAPNDKGNKGLFSKAAMANFRNEPDSIVLNGSDRFEWIATPSKNIAHNQFRPGIDKDESLIVNNPYKLTGAPFWSYPKEVWCGLSGIDASWGDRWFENIAWSNLYKIAPSAAGNPTGKMMALTSAACVDILKAEIDELKPTHILFLTGWDWFANRTDNDPAQLWGPKKNPYTAFSEIVNFKNKKYIGKNQYRGGSNGIYVEGTATYTADWGTAKAVIACRPEAREKTTHTQCIIDAFKKTF